MAQILIRNLDEHLVEQLKEQAAQNSRSLQAEVKTILEQAARINPNTARQLAAKIRKQFQGRTLTNSVELIREEREQ